MLTPNDFYSIDLKQAYRWSMVPKSAAYVRSTFREGWLEEAGLSMADTIAGVGHFEFDYLNEVEQKFFGLVLSNFKVLTLKWGDLIPGKGYYVRAVLNGKQQVVTFRGVRTQRYYFISLTPYLREGGDTDNVG